MFFFLADESVDEEVLRLQMKEEEDIDMLHSWMQVGGFPAQPEGDAWVLLLEVGLISFLFYMAFYSPLYSYLHISLSFYLSGVGPAEKGQFPVRGGPQDRSGRPMPGN